MKVIDHALHHWFLLQDGERLLLDVNCSHGAVGTAFLMQLDADEADAFARDGRASLDRLADRIPDSAPGMAGTASVYAARDLSRALGSAAAAAIADWQRSP